MVVLEGGGMLSSASNQYLQPDYLSPLPTTLDAKKSPLALLAQTCSQIGADSPSTKALLPPLEKTKKVHSSASSENGSSARSGASPSHKTERSATSRSSPPSDANKLAFKPYETNVLTKKPSEERPSSKSSTTANPEDGRKSATEVRAPSRKSTPSSTPAPAEKSSSAPPADREKSVTPPQGASPIIRSGLEILQGGQKDVPAGSFKPGSIPSGLSGLNNLSALCSGCPPGLDPSNPAFRPPFAGGPFSHHHAALLAAGYPSAAPGPYVSYARVKTAAGGEALVPVCKDPYCTGCQFSMHNANVLVGGGSSCPSGCTQCDHQKYGLAAAALGMLPPGLPPSLSPYAQLGRPYVCSWMVGEAYCGKRFATPDELLQHLRTHTSPTAGDPATSTSMSSLLNSHSLYSTAALHRGYPNPPLSPLSAARYHPYSKPGLSGPLGASPFSAFNPTALGPYYSPYSVYGQRIGAAVHQ
ncbi:UNVERIFIED_CONTAM: hypothetical protein PYX00_002808 [Menopon gallinae]|uniref:C2H2-type domain-containing protein n=1 Tax=Menopon gallinae TaxID=328185 RepID=A0AAW2HZ99_9NEOP